MQPISTAPQDRTPFLAYRDPAAPPSTQYPGFEGTHRIVTCDGCWFVEPWGGHFKWDAMDPNGRFPSDVFTHWAPLATPSE